MEITSDPDARSVRVAVKVVDIFGNDTMTIVDVAVKKQVNRKRQRPDGPV